jgi:hypothetical protein
MAVLSRPSQYRRFPTRFVLFLTYTEKKAVILDSGLRTPLSGFSGRIAGGRP